MAIQLRFQAELCSVKPPHRKLWQGLWGLFLAILLAGCASGTATGPGSRQRVDLGRLVYEQGPRTDAAYCSYRIVAVVKNPKEAAYRVGDLICIRCCLQRNPPWPPLDQGQNNCTQRIRFTSSDGRVVYDADNVSVVCTACPDGAAGHYACP